MNKKFTTPIDRQVKAIMDARNKFAVLIAFNDLVEQLVQTDKLIETMPDGEEKELMVKAQQESWELIMSDNMCDSIIVEE